VLLVAVIILLSSRSEKGLLSIEQKKKRFGSFCFHFLSAFLALGKVSNYNSCPKDVGLFSGQNAVYSKYVLHSERLLPDNKNAWLGIGISKVKGIQLKHFAYLLKTCVDSFFKQIRLQETNRHLKLRNAFSLDGAVQLGKRDLGLI
jgi:hypothetical protein